MDRVRLLAVLDDVHVEDAVVGLGAKDLHLVVRVIGQEVVQRVNLVHCEQRMGLG